MVVRGVLGRRLGVRVGGGRVSHFVAEGKVDSVEVEEEEEEEEELIGGQGVSLAWPRPHQGGTLIA